MRIDGAIDVLVVGVTRNASRWGRLIVGLLRFRPSLISLDFASGVGLRRGQFHRGFERCGESPHGLIEIAVSVAHLGVIDHQLVRDFAFVSSSVRSF